MKRKVLARSLLGFSILGIVVSLTGCSQRCFVGNCLAESGCYQLDVDYMNGTDYLTMEIAAGDTL